MNYIIKNTAIVTMDNDKVIENGYIIIENGEIVKVGDGEFLGDDGKYTVIDGENKLVMPGLINCHTHTPMGIMRSYGSGLPLDRWLNEKIFPVEDKLTEDDMYWGSMLAICEMLSTGTTTFNDMYFQTHMTAKAVIKSGMRAVLTYCGTCFAPYDDYNTLKRVENNRRLFEDYKTSDKIKVSVSPHAVYTCTDDFLADDAKEAKRLNTLIHTHLSETVKENDDCLTEKHKSPTEHMRDLGIFDSPTVAAHCVHLSNDDIDILKEYDVSVVNNPTSNLKLGSGICDISKLMNNGVNVTLGTDGASSNNNLNMFEEMHIASILVNGSNMDASLISANDVLKMATVNGAKALGFDKIGAIKEGYKADIIMLDLDKPHFMPMHSLVDNLVYSAQGSDVCMTMVDGEVLYRDGKYLTIDINEVKENINRIYHRLFD